MKASILSFLILLSSTLLYAQQPYYHGQITRSTGNSGTGANIDVKYHRFVWNLNPDGAKIIQGSVTTYFVTTASNVKTITFDFNKASFNNSNLIVKYHGNTVSHSFPGTVNPDILSITLPSSLPANRLDSVTIFYSGTPPARDGDAEGFQKASPSGAGTTMFYTLSESYEDKDWWPCKADMQDKIDSIDFQITTPSAFRAAANGMLVQETTSGSNKTYYFKHRYPIASYLVAIAVAKYNVFPRGTVNIGGTNMPVDYYITIGRGSNPTAQLNAMDFVKDELVAFSEKFGDYPFKNEKYGMYEFGWGGGMEHQTFSAMGWSSMSSAGTIAHELMHQWFGDKVTFATWEHLWLAEGFARYGEALAGELVPALGVSPVSRRNSFKSAANGNTLRTFGCIIPKATIANSNTIWGSGYGSSVYERGAMVVSMLRTLVGDDKFFEACRNYLNDPLLAYKSAVTADLQRHFEAVLDGFDLTPFFNSFVVGNGYPSYTGANAIKWYDAGGGKINIGVGSQTKSAGSNVSYYYTPIALRVQGAGGRDTILVVYDQNGKIAKAGNGIGSAWGPVAQFHIGFTPTSVTFDPFHMTLATGTTVPQIVMNVSGLRLEGVAEGNDTKLTLTAEGDKLTNEQVLLEKSTDGVQFAAIGSPAEKRYADGTNKIYWADSSPDKVTFYRAKWTELSGKELYSNTVKITSATENQWSIVENPVKNKLKIKLADSGLSSSLSISVYDLSGKKMLEKKHRIAGEFIELKHNLPSGLYILSLQQGVYAAQSKFIVE